MEIKFCDFTAADGEKIKEVFQTGFEVSNRDFEEIEKVYQVFKSNFQGKEAKKREMMEKSKLKPRTDVDFKKIFAEDSTNVGVDLPVLLTSDNSKKTVFIVAEDPLRNDPETNVVFSTPFGVHKDKKAVYWRVIEFLLSSGYRVYLTDIYKLWVKKGKSKEKLPTDLLETFRGCLQKEIEYFNPDLVITYGKPAKDLFSSFSYKIPSLSFAHPSGMNSKTWKKILNENSNIEIRATSVNKFEYMKSKIEHYL